MEKYFFNDEEADAIATTFFQNYYEDRGKIKWSGFFLSEHTAALKKHREYIDGSEAEYHIGF